MKKVLIVSDSHGLTKELEMLKNRHGQDMDLMIHCGDSELMADHKAIEDFHVVRGNCDYESMYPEDLIKEIDGLKIFITHGHRYSVKSSLMSLRYRAEELKANVVCFGHSHILGAELIDGILFINPGSLRLPRLRSEPTYVILSIDKNNIQLDVLDYDSGEILELRQNFSLPNL